MSGGSEPPQSDMAYVIGKIILATQLPLTTLEARHFPGGLFSYEKQSLLNEKPTTTLCDAEVQFYRKHRFCHHPTIGIAAFGKAELAAEICSTHFAANTSLPIAR